MIKKILIIDDTEIFLESARIILKNDYDLTVKKVEDNFEKFLVDINEDLVIIGSDKELPLAIPNFKKIFLSLKGKAVIFIFPEKSKEYIPYVPLRNIHFLTRKAKSLLSLPNIIDEIIEESAISKKISNLNDVGPGNKEFLVNMMPFIKIPSKSQFLNFTMTTLPLFFKKELGMREGDIARLIHYNSAMKDLDFLMYDCGFERNEGIFEYLKIRKQKEKNVCGTLFINDIDLITPLENEEIGYLIDKLRYKEVSEKIGKEVELRIVASSQYNLDYLWKNKIINEEIYYSFSAAQFSLYSLYE
ncbi:MAG: hypothetical protein D6734_12055, partial [Candidatus Schekmanbacteria bacterium]